MSPLSGVPSGTELAVFGFGFAAGDVRAPAVAGDGVSGVLKGCAAEVEVTGGGRRWRFDAVVAALGESGCLSLAFKARGVVWRSRG